MPGRVALILPSSTYRAADFLKAARAVDAEVVIASEAHQAMTEQMGPAFVRIDLSRPEGSATDLARSGPFDAVVSVDDGGVVIAALTAARLGLAHNPPEAVAAARDKAAMRRIFAEAGVPQPDFRTIAGPGAAEIAAADLGTPVVIKPTSLAGGRGVIRVDDAAEAALVASRAAEIARAGRSADSPLVVERFVPGAEVAVEALIADGALTALAIFDKPDQTDGPYFEETMLVTPSRLAESLQRQMVDAAQAAVTALGMVEGPAHVELRAGPQGPVVIEVAARPIGGLCSRALTFGLLGASLETVLLRHALRLPQGGLEREEAASGALMIPITHEGIFHGIDGREEAAATPGVTGIEITVPVGQRVAPLPEGDRYLGFVFAKGERPDAVESSLREAWARLAVRIAGDGQTQSVSSCD